MPTADSSNEFEQEDREKDRDRDNDRNERGDRGKQKVSASSKAKDLSHVPCKFFKVGGCTAGSSCPFSHSMQEPGGQKETCAWFVKGNCKFGHKCALAHILPGQSMAMDRKNKKAAQVAASGGPSTGTSQPNKETKPTRTGNAKRDPHASGQGGSATARNPLLAGGSTAPTRVLNSASAGGRLPLAMPLKATISPSAPAPPLKDTDFTSFSSLDENDQLPSAPAQRSSNESSASNPSQSDNQPPKTQNETSLDAKANTPPSPVPLPLSAPRHTPQSINTTTQPDFGPIGSPPTSARSHASPSRLNGAGAAALSGSPLSRNNYLNGVSMTIGTSSPIPHDNNGFLSTSPFSAPGTQTTFRSYTDSTMARNNAGVGIASSLGSGLAMGGGKRGWGASSQGDYVGQPNNSLSSSVHRRLGNVGTQGEYEIGVEYDEYDGKGISGRDVRNMRMESAVDEDDLEEFLPSSLNELLTAEERKRRFSRSRPAQVPTGSQVVDNNDSRGGLSVSGAGGANTQSGHRYSRSVPAPSLLGDMKSIWSDTSAHPLPSAANRLASPPGSYTSSSGFGGRNVLDGTSQNADDHVGGYGYGAGSPSFSILNPSNASAAFLPGLQHQYLNAKAKQQQQLGGGGTGRGLRNTSSPFLPSSGLTAGRNAATSPLANSFLGTISGNTTTNPSQLSQTFRPSGFDSLQTNTNASGFSSNLSHPIPSGVQSSNSNDQPNGGLNPQAALSPSTRALQSHAPGQSLPQGLAAGYSIHALPPPSGLALSPGSAASGGFAGAIGSSPGINAAFAGPYGVADWSASSPTPPSQNHYNMNAQTYNTNANNNGSGTMDSMLSRLSYGAVVAGGRTSSPSSGAPPNTNNTPSAASTTANAAGGQTVTTAATLMQNLSLGPPPGLHRNPNVGGRYQSLHQSSQTQHGVGPLSPLRRPAVTRDDDDDLFSMDG